jgi:hypothetical protein
MQGWSAIAPAFFVCVDKYATSEARLDFTRLRSTIFFARCGDVLGRSVFQAEAEAELIAIIAVIANLLVNPFAKG